MATLTQKTGEQTLYLGWYGMCPEGSTNTAQVLNLLDSTYADGSELSWEGGQKFHTKLAKITQVEVLETGFGYFDQIGMEAWNSFGFGMPFQGHAFTQLVPGKAYLITIRAAPGQTGTNQDTVNIPEFYWTKIGQSDSTYRLTDNCYEG